MTWWKKLFGSDGTERVDYHEEGLTLLRQEHYHEALTSFRLALKESSGDPVVLQHIAITYTRIGMTEEAAKTYRHVLQRNPEAAGAHYGLAYILLHTGEEREAVHHLRAFLDRPPSGGDAARHIEHARETLQRLTGEIGSEVAPDGPR